MNDMLRQITRNSENHQDDPSAAVLDSQSVKTVASGEEQGFDGGKLVKGRKRFLVVDTLGLLLIVMVMRASRSDSSGGSDILEELHQKFPSIKKVWADSAFGGRLVDYAQQWYQFVLEIVRPAADQHGFQVHPKRWIVERTLSWLNWSRRLSKEYEKWTDSSEAMITISMIRLMLKRLEPVLSVI
jgi:putative transposase